MKQNIVHNPNLNTKKQQITFFKMEAFTHSNINEKFLNGLIGYEKKPDTLRTDLVNKKKKQQINPLDTNFIFR